MRDGDSTELEASIVRTELAALKAERDELHRQDRLKTREINVLVVENRALIKERDELREALRECEHVLALFHGDYEPTLKVVRAALKRTDSTADALPDAIRPSDTGESSRRAIAHPTRRCY